MNLRGADGELILRRQASTRWKELLMSLKVVIPTPLRKHTGGAEIVEVDAGTVKEVIDRLESRHPGIRSSICDESGALRRFINIYVDGEDVRFLDNLATEAQDGSEISIVPAIAGGK